MHELPRIGAAAIGICAIAAAALAQPHVHRGMPKQALMTARADVAQAVPKFAGASTASATGAFVLSADAKTVKYRFTWDGLTTGSALRIDVHNFGRGAAGASIATLCEAAGRRCPAGNGGTIEGQWNVSANIAREMATERVYVDVHTEGAQGGELRGQILPLPWMVHSRQFLVRLKDGTATLYVSDFPQGTQLQFDLTVAALPKGDTIVEFRRGASRAGTVRVDAGAIQRRGGMVSGTLRVGDDRGAALDPNIVAAIDTGRAVLAVIVDGKVITTGKLEPVE